jgi:hypothetical protein
MSVLTVPSVKFPVRDAAVTIGKVRVVFQNMLEKSAFDSSRTSTTDPVFTVAVLAMAWPAANEFSGMLILMRELAPKLKLPPKFIVPFNAKWPLTIVFGVTVPRPPKVAPLATVTVPPAPMLPVINNVPALTVVLPL